MPTLTKDPREAAYYQGLAELARELRQEIITGDFKRFPSSKPAKATTKTCMAECVASGGSTAECKADCK